MKNKKGKGGIITGIVLAGIIAIALFLVFMYAIPNSVVTNRNSDSSSGCSIAPSVNLLATNTLVAGTSPTISANYSIYNDAYVGSIPNSLAKGSSLDVLVTASNYLNAKNKINSLDCSTNDLKFAMTPYQIPTYTIYQKNTAVIDSLTGASATGTNITSSANQITLEVEISGVPDKSTGDMLVVIEYANKTEIASSGISLAGATRVSTPTWYTVSATTSSVASFKVPAIVDGGSESYDLTFTAESGKTMGAVGAGLYTTIYTLNPVILDSQTGTFLTENTWENSLGADQTIANVDYDGYFI